MRNHTPRAKERVSAAIHLPYHNVSIYHGQDPCIHCPDIGMEVEMGWCVLQHNTIGHDNSQRQLQSIACTMELRGVCRR